MVWTPRSEGVIAEVAEEYGVTVDDIRGKKRDPLTVDARDKVMYTLAVPMGLGVARVARMFNRNGTAVGRRVNKYARKEETR